MTILCPNPASIDAQYGWRGDQEHAAAHSAQELGPDLRLPVLQ
ncbi:MAG: hypothetical protein ACLUNV_11580 [Sutterella wadsworthensis]